MRQLHKRQQTRKAATAGHRAKARVCWLPNHDSELTRTDAKMEATEASICRFY